MAPVRALQGIRAGSSSVLTHLQSALSLGFLGCKMDMKAAPSLQGAYED